MPNLKNYMSLAFAGRDVSAGTNLYVSHGAIFGPDWKPRTIAWDVEWSDPENQHGSWTILTGPAYYNVDAFARLMQMEEACSVHIWAYHATAPTAGQVDGIDNVTSRREFAEWPVLPHETHVAPDGTVTYSNTHVLVPCKGFLPEGEKLRIALDYWNAGATGKLVGGSVYGYWGRPSDEIIIPPVTP